MPLVPTPALGQVMSLGCLSPWLLLCGFGLPSPFPTPSHSHYLVGLVAMGEGFWVGWGWLGTGRKPWLPHRLGAALRPAHSWALEGHLSEPCCPNRWMSGGLWRPAEAWAGVQYGPYLSALPPPFPQCLEKFPVIQHFKFGSLLPIHPVTSC